MLEICYDFNKTPIPDNMQAHGYIQSIGYDVQRFWDETDQMAHENGIDSDLVICARYVCHHEHNWGIKKTAPRAMPTLSNVPIK